MIRVTTADPAFNTVWCNASRTLPVHDLERPRQYGARWREAYRCRVDGADEFPYTWYVFDKDEDYTWFMLRWS
jgi:hypothetical protein